MESKQPPSDKPSDLEPPKPDESQKNLHADPIKLDVEHPKPVDPDVLSSITESEVRTGAKSTSSKRQGISTNPMALVIVGFLLSAIPGGFLTFYYGSWQQELAARRSFSDELNKIRIQKIGSVWEKIDKNEFALDDMLDRANKTPGSNKEDFDKIEKLIHEDLELINENRFWLGEPAYDQLKEYMEKTGLYASDMLLGPPGIDLSEALKKRKQAKQDILQMRIMFLKGEPEPSK